MTIEELFASLSVEVVDRLIEQRQEEDLSLDFKTAAGPELRSSDDKKNLAQVLSGFANSAGGIVIWGVSTQKDPAGQDVATARKLISSVAAFRNRLEEATPLSVTPAVAGVRHRAFEVADGSGFAATYVPESDIGPHMALAGHDRYFKRAGDRFYRMAHYDIADMFGRRQRPSLRLSCKLQKGKSFWQNGSHEEIRIIVSLTNDGRASAVAPHIRLQVTNPYSIVAGGVSAQGANAPLAMTSEAAQPPIYAFIGRSDFVAHPKASFQIAEISATFRGRHAIVPCELSYSAAALNSMFCESMIRIGPAEIAEVLGRPVEAHEE
jgi:hypothetical protein